MSETATQLFARHKGEAVRSGVHVCFYCGGFCDDGMPAKKHVKPTFTALDTVAQGTHVCGGCLCAMNEKAELQLIDGAIRNGQKTRCYSLIAHEGGAFAATKAHRKELLALCRNPPSPPYVISISDSGQKHLLYLSKIGKSAEVATVNLEGEAISYRPADFEKRLALCLRMCAAIGKPALSGSLGISQQMIAMERFGEDALTEWLAVCDEPLTKLAVWLTPPKRECEDELCA